MCKKKCNCVGRGHDRLLKKKICINVTLVFIHVKFTVSVKVGERSCRLGLVSCGVPFCLKFLSSFTLNSTSRESLST